MSTIIKAGVVFVFIGMIAMCINGNNKNTYSPQSVSIPEPQSPKYPPEQVKSAKKIMENVRALANVFEEGGHLVVEFHQYLYPEDINKRLTFIRAVADADCVLTGSARSIFFYNPGNVQIAKADSLNGVRLGK